MKAKNRINVIFLAILVMINVLCASAYATEIAENGEPVTVSASGENTTSEDSGELNSASKKILENTSRKDKRIAELSDKYNDKVYGTVAYYLEVAQKYSLPICFIGITMGAFNFLIIGNKKLDKKEQGFGWIVGFTIGLVVFNVLPLVFALFVAGR